MSRKLPHRTSRTAFDILLERAQVELRDQFDDFRAAAVGDSEIERVFMVALSLYVHTFNLGEVFQGFMIAKDRDHAERLLEDYARRDYLIVQPQRQRPGWRVDFEIYAWGYGHNGTPAGWRTLIIECDGHDFHERTKEQAKRDRSRDRDAQMEGATVFRFTGAELYRDSWDCASRVIDWAMRGI